MLSIRLGKLARRVLPAAVLACVLPASPKAAEEDPFALLRAEQVVTGASKRPQPVSEAPASITVVTAEEIQIQGYRTLAEALQWVRGLYATNDRNYAYVGVRGLLRPGDFNNKMLLAVDGHTLVGSVFADVLFGEEVGIALEDVERIEVVRGPGSALYGSNAALAIVNVVTRTPGRQRGTEATVRTGAWGESRAHLRMADARPGRPEWAMSVSWLDSQGRDLFYSEYDDPISNDGIAEGVDGEHALALRATAGWAGWRLAAKFNERRKVVPTAAYGTDFGDGRSRTFDGVNFVELSSTHVPAQGLEIHTRAYWNGTRYRATYAYGPTTNFDVGNADVLGTEWRAHWAVGRGQIFTLGAEGQSQIEGHLLNYNENPYALNVDLKTHGRSGAAYAQHQARLGGRSLATVGLRVDASRHEATVLAPRADLVYEIDRSTRLKLLAGTAFRAPSTYEARYVDNLQIANPSLLAEQVGSVEAGIERQWPTTSLIFTAYRSHWQHVIDLVGLPSGEIQYQNRARVIGHGVEGELSWMASASTRLRLDAAWNLSRDEGDESELTNSPRWNIHAVLGHSPTNSPLTLGARARYLSSRWTLARDRTEAVVVVDARVGWSSRDWLVLGIEGRNLLDQEYSDPGGPEHLQDLIAQDGRSGFVTLSVRNPRIP